MDKTLIVAMLIGIFLVSGLAQAQQASNSPVVSPGVTYCCEQTKKGAWCQNAKKEECDPNMRMTPTSCEATSFCSLGFCYDSQEGTCAERTPQKVCETSGGVWAGGEDTPPQCELGCCVLGDQAALVSLVRCKKLSSFFGLSTDYRKNIKSENACIDIAKSQEKGACVYQSDFQNTCKFTTRSACLSANKSGNTFHKDFLCTAEDLGTVCAPTTRTTCAEGRDEVYFVDTCGNPANIYDASKINDKTYWRKIVQKAESCGSGSSNANSAACGNCDYFLGSYCQSYSSSKDTRKPSYGDYICRDLSCKKTYDGENYRHGEAWCVSDNGGSGGEDAVGSRYVRHMCVASEEIIEPCADFRQEVCIQDQIETSAGSFQQAGCRANRWQDCLQQGTEEDCENLDKRDCMWIKDIRVFSTAQISTKNYTGTCVPEFVPGFNFWGEGDAAGICAQASETCTVVYEKGMLSGKKCKENCECAQASWKDGKNAACNALGDCGIKKNYVGREAGSYGYTVDTNTSIIRGKDYRLVR